MPRRSTSLNNITGTAITREIDSKYDVVKSVSNYLVEIETLANEDIDALIAALNEAKDFTGITVVTGSPASWDAITKVLTVPQGDTGDTGATGADGEDGLAPVMEFSMDGSGNLQYEVVAYEDALGVVIPLAEEW